MMTLIKGAPCHGCGEHVKVRLQFEEWDAKYYVGNALDCEVYHCQRCETALWKEAKKEREECYFTGKEWAQ